MTRNVLSFLALAVSTLAGYSVAYSQPAGRVPDAPQILDVGAGAPVFGTPPNTPVAPGQCEAPSGKKCWYVDSAAQAGGNGSKNSPYNSFEKVAGYLNGTDYVAGSIRGGDFLYVRGTFRASQHQEDSHNMTIHLGRGSQGGSASQPTVIKTWPGSPRAVFDGEYQLIDLIHIRALDGDPNNGVRIENVEVARANGRGVHIAENVAFAEVSNILVRDGKGDGFDGVGGGVVFRMVSNLVHNFILHDSVIHDNNREPVGGENNIGGVGILSEAGSVLGSTITIYNNEIYNEGKAIRHKHWGNTRTVAYSNRIHDCQAGFHIRATYSDLHHNMVYNCGSALETEAVPPNSGADTEARFYNNTIYNTPILVNTTYGETSFRRRIDLYSNIFSNSDSINGVLLLGPYQSNHYNKADFVSRDNVFNFPQSGSTFLYHQGRGFGLTLGLEYLGDTGSIAVDPRFENAPGGDFRLQPGSPASGRGAL